MREHILMKKIQASLNIRSASTRTFRNNVGAFKDARGVWVKYGLGVGSCDLVGIVAPSGRLFAVEVKTEDGKTTPEQEAWIAMINRFGGVAGVCRSVEDAEKLVESAVSEDVARAVAVLRKHAPHLLVDST